MIPTLGRAEKLPSVLENIKTTTKTPHRVYFIIEESDKKSQETLNDLDCEVIVGKFGTYPNAINGAFPKTSEPYLFIGADDLKFTEGWDVPLPTMVVGTNDLHNPSVLSGEHATHYFVNRKYIEETGGTFEEIPGKVLHEYDHNYCDTEFVETARCRGVYSHNHDSVVEHIHPGWKLGKLDSTYKKGGKNYEKDMQTFQRRRVGWLQKYGPV